MPQTLLSHSRSGRLDATRIGLRVAPAGAEFVASSDAELAAAEFAADDLTAGSRRLAGIEIELVCNSRGLGVEFTATLRNRSQHARRVDSLIMGFRWQSGSSNALRFLQNGWQSWSFSGAKPLDADGERPFPSGSWLRGMHHALPTLPLDRAGWHESHSVAVAGTGAADRESGSCLVGVLETGRNFGLVYLRAQGNEVEIEVELLVETLLSPGEACELETVQAAIGDDASRLLEAFAGSWGLRAGARTTAPFQAGWCSWYHFFHGVTEEHVLRNLDALAASKDELPIEVVQIDDGYQSAIGDWLSVNDKFPSGLGAIAKQIRSAGFTPGLWTAPFCVVRESEMFAAHPDWLLQSQDGEFRGLIHPQWSEGGWVYALDPTHPEVETHIEALFRELVALGFDYLKLDFLYVAAMRASAHDPQVPRSLRLKRGLEAVRRGAGDAAFLLGCGCPMGPAVGVVDGMRIGPDVAPRWSVDPAAVIPGLEPALPSLHGSLRSTLQRVWMHRRLWLNDPDCLMARRSDTGLSETEVRTLAAVVGTSGGMGVFSDDVSMLSASDRRELADTLALAREVDAGAARGVARLLDPLALNSPAILRAELGPDTILCSTNLGESPVHGDAQNAVQGVVSSDSPATSLLGTRSGGSDFDVELAAHEARCLRLPRSRQLTVFCDFDGTFAIQDVGATLAKKYAADLRPALWKRYEAGELTAWDYNMILLDGMEVPLPELHAFLETIELDPGARRLVDWCRKRSVPFRILSDGFDYNLDRLQILNELRFEYTANLLRYEGDLWRIAASCPNPDCFCGTGACKRGFIESYQRSNPSHFCVHVGNGAVSDLCGALAADLAFAKDSLAPALAERGAPYENFETLHDVVEALERLGWS